MGNNIFVAIIGLSLSTSNQLKSLFQNAVCEQLKITWTNLAHPELDLVIANENLVDSNAIKNLENKNVLILEIHQIKNKENILTSNKMYIPFTDETVINKWLINNTSKEFNTEKLIPQKENLLESFNSLFHKNQSDYFLCHINNSQTLIIDKKKHEVWIDEGFKSETILTLNIEALDFNQFVNMRLKKEKYDLSLWLWNYLWSNSSEILDPPAHSYYRLKYWPQPNNNIPKDTLKIASCLQYGANIDDIKKHLNINSELFAKFIYISLASNIIENIQPHEAKFKINNDENTNSTLRSFFSKMRKKLGI